MVVDHKKATTRHPSLWARVKHFFRSFIYPRRFIVTLVDSVTGETMTLNFKAIDKTEETGRFFGDCIETIIVDHNDYRRNFKGNILAQLFKII